MRINTMLKENAKYKLNYFRKIIFLFPVSFIFLSSQSLASGTSNISFVDNQRIPVTLSDTNINRIVVSNDQITNILCPSDYCTSTHNPGDESGAAYIKLLTTTPFTIFLATNAGHHVSLQVTPKSANGKTLVLNPAGASPVANKWERESSYRKLLVTLIKDMMDNKVPDGYGYTTISNSDKQKIFHGLGTMQMKGVWTGDHLIGTEYVFKNESGKTLTIPDSAFYHHGIRLVAQTSQSVSPGEYNVVYEITSRG